MLKIEYLGGNLVKTYSDSGKLIRQNETGIEYCEAIDILGKYTYSETDKDIDSNEEEIIEEE